MTVDIYESHNKRIAELEAERDLVQSACNDISDQLRDRTIEIKAIAAGIAELEAEIARLHATRGQFVSEINETANARIAELEAENARLTALVHQALARTDLEKRFTASQARIVELEAEVARLTAPPDPNVKVSLAEREIREGMYRAGVAAEREACAAIADRYAVGGIQKKTAELIAAAVRARHAP